MCIVGKQTGAHIVSIRVTPTTVESPSLSKHSFARIRNGKDKGRLIVCR